MKKIKILSGIIISIVFFSSCQKIGENKLISPKEIALVESMSNSARNLISTTDTSYANYVVLNFSQLANEINRDSSYNIDAFARFSNGNGQNINVGPIGIGNNIIMNAGADSLYHYQFPLSEGIALFGNSLPIYVTEPNVESRLTNGSTERPQRIMLVPNQIFPISVNFPSSVIDRTAVLPLNWAPDPNNQFGKVQIDVTYYSGLSLSNSTGMPNSVQSLSYQVTDNGNFTIPAADLNRFPRGSYIGISIARVWSTRSVNNVSYVAYVEGRTIPLLVVSSGPLVVDFNVNRILFSYRLNSIVNGGIAPFSYQWRKKLPNSNTWSSIFSTRASFFGSVICETPSQGSNWDIELKVTDNIGNTQSIVKNINISCPE